MIHDLEWWKNYSANLNAEIVALKLENMRLRRLNKHKKDVIARIIKLVNQNGPIEFSDGDDYIRHYTRVHK